MWEYSVGFCVGVAVTGIVWAIARRIQRDRRIIAQEKQYVVVQAKVDSIVQDLHVMIYGGHDEHK